MLKRFLVLLSVVAVLAGGCGSDETESTAGSTTTPEAGATEPAISEPDLASGVPADLAITEVVFGDHVTITNLGSDAVSVDGLWLCNRPDYMALPAAVIAPGATLDVSAAEFAVPAGGGEVALYTSNSFGDPSAMVDYVSWGSGGGRAGEAAEAGLWPAGEAVAASGAGISASEGGSSAADWSDS